MPILTGMTHWLRLALAVCIGALAILPTTVTAAPAPPIDHIGSWLTDANGRVVILHGWNMTNKLPPYQPAAVGFGRDDARFLARHGFNTVRVGIIYAGLEPRPGVIDRGYLRGITRTVRVLEREGIFVMLDFHQDLFNERFQGEGFPDWATRTDGLPNEPRTVEDTGFTVNYTANPALNRAFDHLWLNDRFAGGAGLQDRFARAWRAVARRMRDEPRVLGYDLLNELWPGSQWPTCANPAGCPAFDRAVLTPFSTRVLNAIREVDRRKIVFYEPQVLFNNGAASNHGDTGDGRAGFSFHLYCLSGVLTGGSTGCDTLEPLVFQNAKEQAARNGDALMLSEFAATDDIDVITRVTDLADRFMVSWQQWAYWNADPVAGVQGGEGLIHDINKPPTGDNVKRAKLRAAERPYPRVVAGTPQRYGFDTRSRTFELRYSTYGPDGQRFRRTKAITEVTVPRIHYRRGYRVRAKGARVISSPRARVLRLRSARGADEVRVRVEPRRGR